MTNSNQSSISGIAISSFVLGLVGLLSSTVPIINNLSFIMGIVGLVFGIIALVKICKEKGGKGLAIAGVVLSAVTFVCVLGSQAAYTAILNQASNEIEYSYSQLESYD